MKISVAMITKNEEKSIQKVVEDIRKAVPDAEILIVDSSEDKTPEIAKSLGIKVIRQYPPQGYGPAFDLALRSAIGDAIVTLDCDSTYPADMIPVLASYVLDKGYDLADGTRLQSKPTAMPWANYVANRAFALLASMLFFHWLTDLHSGMRAYKKSLITNLRYQAKGAALPVELLLRPLKQGYRVKVVPISYLERQGQSTMKPLESSWWTIKRIMRVRFGK